jgi:hypothetical protein
LHLGNINFSKRLITAEVNLRINLIKSFFLLFQRPLSLEGGKSGDLHLKTRKKLVRKNISMCILFFRFLFLASSQINSKRE